MALAIATNTGALMAAASATSVNKDMETSMERLSTGKRINSAADDAAGVAIASRMTSEINGLNQAARNAADGQGLAATGEGAMVEIENILQRMREISVQAVNDTNSSDNRSALNDEITQLQEEIDRIVSTTNFNGTTLLDGTAAIALQVGASAGETMNFSIGNLGTASLGSLTGAAATGAVTDASVKGTEATTTKTQLTFNGNDTYTFDLSLVTAGGTAVKTITGDVTSNSASDIVTKINAAIRDSSAGTHFADTAASIDVSFSGNVVTINNNYGGAVTVAQNGTNAFSTSGSTIGFTSVAGGTGSSNLNLGTANSLAATTFSNANAFVAPTAASVGITESGTLTGGDIFEVVLDDGAGNALTVLGSATAGATADEGLQSLLTAFNALGDKKGYSMALASNTLTVSRADGVNFSIAEGANASATGTLNESIGTALLSTTAVSTTSGVAQVGDEVSNMYLDFTGADTYSFDFSDGTNSTGSFDVTYDGTAASLSAVATVIGTQIDATFAATHDMSVSVENGRIKVSDANGQSFSISSFASTGSGKVMASADSGQGATTDGVLLDDTSFASTATTVAAGTPVASEAELTFSANDRFSFTISDGSATAVVSEFAADISSTATTASIAAEINVALTSAGLGDLMTATADGSTAGLLTLTHANGKQITIDNFKSASTATMKVEAGTGSTGFTKFLDDGDGTSSETISGISVLSNTAASSAIDIIDRALKDVSAERSNLGAIVNRLDNTINNLTSVSINLSGARGRIEDADFAAESTSLTKSQILQQASTAMLAQANASKQNVLSLLQG